MRILMILVALATAVFSSGCSLLTEKAAEKVSGAVVYYCDNETYQARQIYRDSINGELAQHGHSVSVECQGDPVGE